MHRHCDNVSAASLAHAARRGERLHPPLSSKLPNRYCQCKCCLYVPPAAGVGARFHVWETSRWQRASWDVPPAAGPVVQAAWAPASAPGSPAATGNGSGAATQRVLLLSFARSGAVGGAGGRSGSVIGGGGVMGAAGAAAGGCHLVALHLVQDPPSLVAQLMPVLLQDVTTRLEGAAEGSGSADGSSAAAGGGSSGAGVGVIGDWAWDVGGERLAVALRAPHPAAGCVALYATSVDPVVHARLLGFARPAWAGAGARGAGSGVRVAAHANFERGALFTIAAAGHEGQLYNLPAYFK